MQLHPPLPRAVPGVAPAPARLLALLLALLPGLATAQQPAFTFNVPLRLQQIHGNVESIRVSCIVSGDDVATKLSNKFIQPGAGDHEVDLVYEIFANAANEDLTLYTHWRCSVQFKEVGDWIFKTPSPDAQETWLRVRPGAVLDTGLQAFAD